MKELKITKNEKDFLLEAINGYWELMQRQNFRNGRKKRISESLVKKLNLHDVSNNERSEMAVCEHYWKRIGGMDRETYRCQKCGAMR